MPNVSNRAHSRSMSVTSTQKCVYPLSKGRNGRLDPGSGAVNWKSSVGSLQLALPQDQLDLSTSMVILRGLKSLPVRFRIRDA